MQGKKGRCKKCGATIVLKAKSAGASKAAPTKGSAAKSAAPARPTGDEDGPQMYGWLSDEQNQKMIEANRVAPIKSDLQPKYEDVSKNPYGLTKLDETPRCPFCAKEMEEGGVVCLHCGYNTQSRSHGKIIRTYANTPGEQFMWSLPGLLCVAAIAAIIFGVIYLWTGLPDPNSEKAKETIWKEFVRPAQVWGSVAGGFAIVGFGYFAVKRLILEPKPPEKHKK
jgi:hypothetical protein